jgi:hypothetical protein
LRNPEIMPLTWPFPSFLANLHQLVSPGAEYSSQTVAWRFDDAKLIEMLDLIEPLVDIEKSGHQYVDDLNSPAETLVLSVNEYINAAPFGEFPHGEPVPSSPSTLAEQAGTERA